VSQKQWCVRLKRGKGTGGVLGEKVNEKQKTKVPASYLKSQKLAGVGARPSSKEAQARRLLTYFGGKIEQKGLNLEDSEPDRPRWIKQVRKKYF